MTPGHPENFITNGIEVTTGPLGMGICNAVGLALAEKHLAGRFNKPDCEIVDHYTYAIMGDGCNMEGMSGEGASLAAHWELGKLIAFYDDNHISIDGHTDISFTEDVCARYEAYGWHVQHVEDGNTDLDAIRKAVEAAKKDPRPSLIKVTTLTATAPPTSPTPTTSTVPPSAPTRPRLPARTSAGSTSPSRSPRTSRRPWTAPRRVPRPRLPGRLSTPSTRRSTPRITRSSNSIITGKLPEGWADALPTFTPEDAGVATRIHSQTMLNALGGAVPGFIGGSADLAPSNMTLMKQFGDFQKDTPAERNVRYGVREHGMGAIANGIALHSPGFKSYCATFFIFSDYMRSAMRIAALSGAPTLFVMTHDSIGVGEDGPTHQPIEHLASFRAMPGMLMMRPADGNETAGAYEIAVEQTDRPTTFALSRQVVPNLANTSREGVRKGAYVVAGPPPAEDVDCIIIGTGTELSLAVEAAEKLGAKARAVSMPCWSSSRSSRTSTRSPSSPSPARLSCPSRLAPPSAGPSTPTSPSAAMTSAPPPPRASSTRSSASPSMRASRLPSLSCKFCAYACGGG